MAHIVVDIPEPKTGLDGAVARQFAEIQKQLMGLMKSHQDSSSSHREEMMKMMEAQQESFVKALTALIASVGKKSDHSDSLLGAIQGLKSMMSDLPGDLKSALETQYRQTAKPVTPKVTVKMDGLSERLDGIEAALQQQLARPKGLRSRTFGSNW